MLFLVFFFFFFFYYLFYFYVFQSAGVQFQQRPHSVQSSPPTSQPNKNDSPNGELASSRHEGVAQQAEPEIVPESRCVLLDYLFFFF